MRLLSKDSQSALNYIMYNSFQMYQPLILSFHHAVCEIAGKDCEIVEDQFGNCWTSVDGTPVGGAGLFNFYYDACIGTWLSQVIIVQGVSKDDTFIKYIFKNTRSSLY